MPNFVEKTQMILNDRNANPDLELFVLEAINNLLYLGFDDPKEFVKDCEDKFEKISN